MPLPLTPKLLRVSYEFLRETPPFRNWRLPEGAEVKFHVTRNRLVQGDHRMENGLHIIRISSAKIGNTHTLLEVMAHEMVHAACDRDGARSEHGRDFHRRARLVCKYHGFDSKSFV